MAEKDDLKQKINEAILSRDHSNRRKIFCEIIIKALNHGPPRKLESINALLNNHLLICQWQFPEAFLMWRKSIFDDSSHTFITEKDYCMEPVWIMDDSWRYLEDVYNGDEDEDNWWSVDRDLCPKIKMVTDWRKRLKLCCTCNKEKTEWFASESIHLLIDWEFECAQCDECYQQTNLSIEMEKVSVLPKCLCKLIASYLQVPFNMKKVASPYDRVEHMIERDIRTFFYEWYCFLVYPADENIVYFLINCNLDSFLYGYVAACANDTRYEMWETIWDLTSEKGKLEKRCKKFVNTIFHD